MKRHAKCKLTIAEEEKLIIEYSSGKSTTELSIKFKISSKTICNILEYYGYKRRTISETLIGSSRARKYFVNDKFFNKINSEQNAYLLGLMFSDGWISKGNIIGFTSKDKELVELFADCINSTYPIVTRVYPNSKNPGYELRITSEIMFNDLQRHGCILNKSLILDFPKHITKKVIRHFIRGVFDGDGCIHLRKNNYPVFSICGSKKMLENINQHLIDKLSLNKVGLVSHANIFRISHSGINKCLKIKEYLYKNSNLYLKRKFDKWSLINEE